MRQLRRPSFIAPFIAGALGLGLSLFADRAGAAEPRVNPRAIAAVRARASAVSLAASAPAERVGFAQGAVTGLTERRWYGWQLLTNAGLSYGLMVGAVLADAVPLAPVGLASLAFTPMLIHLAHGRSGTALASVLLEAVGPWASAFAGAGLECLTSKHNCPWILGFIVGGIGGHFAALTIDTALLAYETVPLQVAGSALQRARRRAAPAPRRASGLAPSFQLVRDLEDDARVRGASFGARGSF